VLVVDQTWGDASISYGLADAERFQQMLASALAENPDCTVLVKIHPDVFSGKKRGHFEPSRLAALPNVQVVTEDVHPVRLIEQAEAVYTVTSQIGFEGLLWGKPVHTFGMPFYAGWGLTRDLLPAPARRSDVTLEQLVHAALISYPRYLDPETGERCEPERLVEWMGLQRLMRERFPQEIVAVGFSRWKRPIVQAYFQGSEVVFKKRASSACKADMATVWGHKPFAGQLPQGVQAVRLEDGFLRSVGLGADLVSPVSWVMDQTGIYFDATCPSDLELILQNQEFSKTLCIRAARLRERIVAGNLTKYNVGSESWQRSATAGRVILVPGQVESDASLAYGAPGVRTNLGLLQTVRAANPDAWVVYKPHPDVLAGLRLKGQGEDQALAWCDEQVMDVAMGELLHQVDEVHTLTSLAGFEALLRGKKVVCYGQPFYSGWGLTTDVHPVVRRTRRLELDALVAGVLILYPTYVSRTTGKFTTPERALDELLAWREKQSPTFSLWTHLKRAILRRVVGVR
jgi:capsular polysaccharide export protein